MSSDVTAVVVEDVDSSSSGSILDTMQGRLQTALPTFNPASIIAIIEAILSALSGMGTLCPPKPGPSPTPTPTPASLQQMLQRRTVGTQIAVRRALLRADIRPRSAQGQEAEAAIYNVGGSASVDELGQLMAVAG